MMSVKVRIDGLRDLRDGLNQLTKATAKNVMRRVLKKRAQPIANHAESLAPVEHGTLKQSVVVGTQLSRRQKRYQKREHKDEVFVFVGPGPLKQATLQEFGTVNHDPQPYMRPAWDANKNRVLSDIKQDMAIEVNKSIARRQRREANKAAKAAKAAKG